MIDFLQRGLAAARGYATYDGTEWAALDSNQNVVPYAAYNPNINAAASTDNVKISGGSPTTLVASETINSLNLENSSGTTGTLNLNGQSLNVSSGGILSSGLSPSEIDNGNLYSIASLPVALSHITDKLVIRIRTCGA